MTDNTAPKIAADTASTEGIELFDQSDGYDPLNIVDADICVQDWTPEEAAKALGKSVRTIRRLLQDGSLEGYKIPGRRRDEWRVKPVKVTDPLSAHVPLKTVVQNESERLWQMLKDKDGKIEALVLRTGYLEALLAERDKEVRLLTDKMTENRHWWHRFSAWFLGVR